MIYCISKKMEVAGCHQLTLPYESPCTRLHGHNWTITVFLASEELNENGMVEDFKHVKNKIHGYLDHQNINELLPFNPTSENVAKWIVEQFPCATKPSSRSRMAMRHRCMTTTSPLTQSTFYKGKKVRR